MARIIRQEALNCAEYFGLNEQQSGVIGAIGSNCVINAGAGTGKTKTLTAAYVDVLINNIMENGQAVTPDNIVAITFTKAAAEELHSRIVAGLISLGREDVAELMGDAWIMTIHAFCNRILKREKIIVAQDFMVDTNFTTIEDSEARELKYEVAKSIVSAEYMRVDEEQSESAQLFMHVKQNVLIDAIIEIADKARVYDIDVADIIASDKNGLPRFSYEKRAKLVNQKIAELTRQYSEAYQREKSEQGFLDFSDQILYTKRLFQAHPEIAESYKDQFGVILIDEFQDTNFTQYGIFKLIATNNIVVVGDKRQSIYSFQGATVEVFDEVLAESGAKHFSEVKLQRNYRSHHQILETVNKLFEDENLFGDDFVALESHEGFLEEHELEVSRKSRTKFIELLPERSNASISAKAGECIAHEFARLQNEEGYCARDMVVLASTRRQLNKCAEVLKSKGFNAVVVGGNDLLSDTYVSGLFALLKVIDNPFDDAALVEASLSMYGRVVDEELAEAARIVRMSRQDSLKDFDTSLWSAYKALALQHPDSSVGFFVNLLTSAIERMASQPLHVVARYFFSASGVAYYLKTMSGEVESYLAEESYENVITFLNLLEYWQKRGMTNRTCFLRCKKAFDNSEKYDFGEVPVSLDPDADQKDTIRLMTVHKSKGLEYPVVAVIGEKSGNGQNGCVDYRILKDEKTAHRQLEISLKKYQMSPDEVHEAEEWCAQNNIKFISKVNVDKKASTYKLSDAAAMKNEQDESKKDEDIRAMYVAMTRAKERLIYVYSGSLPKSKEPAPNAFHTICEAINTFERDNSADQIEQESALGKKRAPFELESVRIDKEGVEDLAACDEGELEREKAVERAALIESFKGIPAPEPFAPLGYAAKDFATWPQVVEKENSFEKLEEITASNIEQFFTCPRQYYFSGIMRVGLLSDTNTAMIRGTAMHTVLEQAANASIINKTCSSQEMFTPEFAKKIQYLYELSAEETQKVINAARNVIQSTWWSELESCKYVKTEAQFYEPLGNEEARYFLHGYIDICGQRPDGSWVALDYKSGTREVTSEKFLTQAKCYALALMREGAKSVDITFVRPEVLGSSQNADIESFTYHFEADDCAEIESFIDQSKKQMELSGLISDEELKALVRPEHCLQYCPYRGPLCAGVQ